MAHDFQVLVFIKCARFSLAFPSQEQMQLHNICVSTDASKKGRTEMHCFRRRRLSTITVERTARARGNRFAHPRLCLCALVYAHLQCESSECEGADNKNGAGRGRKKIFESGRVYGPKVYSRYALVLPPSLSSSPISWPCTFIYFTSQRAAFVGQKSVGSDVEEKRQSWKAFLFPALVLWFCYLLQDFFFFFWMWRGEQLRGRTLIKKKRTSQTFECQLLSFE